VNQILAPPSGAFEYGGVPAPCVGEIAFARDRPPGEAAADTGEQRSADAFLPHALQGERGAAESHEPPRQRELAARAIPAASIPDAFRRAMCSQVQSACVRSHAARAMQVRGQVTDELLMGFRTRSVTE